MIYHISSRDVLCEIEHIRTFVLENLLLMCYDMNKEQMFEVITWKKLVNGMAL